MAKKLFAALWVVAGIGSPAVYAASPGHSAADRTETGLASFYSHRFEGRRTASGDTFRNAVLMAAHPTYPFGTVALVTNLAHGYSVIVRITDRGPSTSHRRKGVIIDLSQSAASQLKMIAAGRVPVSVRVLEWGRGYVDALQQVMTYDPQPVQLPPLELDRSLPGDTDTRS